MKWKLSSISAEANFDWTKYLLGPQVENVQIDENDVKKIVLFSFLNVEHFQNESIDEETNDLTEILHDQTTDIGGVEEEKTIDDLEEQNW